MAGINNETPFRSNKIDSKQLSLINFLHNIGRDNNGNINTGYSGVLINSYYDLEFSLGDITGETDQPLNNILRCRCSSINVPLIRKNYTSIYFGGRQVDIEQNTEFQHEITLRILCDEDANIYHRFYTYMSSMKGNKVFNDASIRILINGYEKIILNHVTIQNLGQLNFDYSNGNSVCYFDVMCRVVNLYVFDTEEMKRIYAKAAAIGGRS